MKLLFASILAIITGLVFLEVSEGQASAAKDAIRLGRGPGVTYFATTVVDNLLSGYSFCKSRKWNLASPQSKEEEEALEAVLLQYQFSGNTWLGAICMNGRWTWLSDNSPVTFNNFGGGGGDQNRPSIGPLPSCGATSDALVISGGTNASEIVPTFKWATEANTEANHVVCQRVTATPYRPAEKSPWPFWFQLLCRYFAC